MAQSLRIKKSEEYSGSPLEGVHLFRSEYSDRNSPFHFLQNRSFSIIKEFGKGVISFGWPGLIGKCRSIFVGDSQ